MCSTADVFLLTYVVGLSSYHYRTTHYSCSHYALEGLLRGTNFYDYILTTQNSHILIYYV